MFMVAKINSINRTFGVMNTRSSRGPEIFKANGSVNHVSTNRKAVTAVNKRPLKCQRTCEDTSANENHTRNDYRRTSERNLKTVEAITNLNDGGKEVINTISRFTGEHEKMKKTFRKMERFLERHPSNNSRESGDEAEELDANPQVQPITIETTTTKTNTILSIPSAFPGESFPTVDPAACIMSIVPRNCKTKQKNTALRELFSLRFIESKNASDPQLQAIYEMAETKDPELQQKVHRMNRYYSQFVNDFHVRDKVLWMDDKLVIPNTLHKVINNRLHYYHHGKSNMFTTAKDIWFPYIHRNIAAMAENCRECTEAGKNLK